MDGLVSTPYTTYWNRLFCKFQHDGEFTIQIKLVQHPNDDQTKFIN